MIVNDIDRLLKIIKILGLNEAQFARSIGINPQNIGQYKKGERPVSPKVWIHTIKIYPKLNPRWVAIGEGKIYADPVDNESRATSEQENISEPVSSYNRCVELLEEKDKRIGELKDTIEMQKKMLDKLFEGK